MEGVGGMTGWAHSHLQLLPLLREREQHLEVTQLISHRSWLVTAHFAIGKDCLGSLPCLQCLSTECPVTQLYSRPL